MDKITDEDRKLANQIAARMSKEVWSPLVYNRESITEIGQWDLLHMSHLNWQAHRNVVRQKLKHLLGYHGVGIARLTKALHRKRPALIPICDSVLCSALGVVQADKPDRVLQCMDELQQVGRGNLDTLSKLSESTKSNGTPLTELRILEILFWVEFGPFRPDEKELARYLEDCT